MIELTAADVRDCLPWASLVLAIENKLRGSGFSAPPRISFDLQGGSHSGGGTLLVMPAWQNDNAIGIKLVTFWPSNRSDGRPSHGATYLMLDARSGNILAILDGEELTARRTAAISLIGSRCLARDDASRLLVVGTGPIACNLVRAYRSTGRFRTIEIFGRSAEAARALVDSLCAEGTACELSSSLQTSIAAADVISAATSATEPLFDGDWVRPGTHVDLVGSFHPTMREVDDRLVARADAIWIDTGAALVESGDLVQPIEKGVITRDAIAGQLRELIDHPSPRPSRTAITIFKAVGFALPDFAAAEAALQREAAALAAEAI